MNEHCGAGIRPCSAIVLFVFLLCYGLSAPFAGRWDRTHRTILTVELDKDSGTG